MRGLNPFRRKQVDAGPDKAPDHKPLERSFVEQVWDAPATFNRATRRRARLWSRIWRWDVAAFDNAPQAPRYIRRHYAGSLFTHPKTRRQRRVRARITRLVARKGIA